MIDQHSGNYGTSSTRTAPLNLIHQMVNPPPYFDKEKHL